MAMIGRSTAMQGTRTNRIYPSNSRVVLDKEAQKGLCNGRKQFITSYDASNLRTDVVKPCTGMGVLIQYLGEGRR